MESIPDSLEDADEIDVYHPTSRTTAELQQNYSRTTAELQRVPPIATRNPDQPNLVFILTDDHGAWAMGCAGNLEIRSPNLDRLAREGIRFDNFFCTSPCARLPGRRV